MVAIATPYRGQCNTLHDTQTHMYILTPVPSEELFFFRNAMNFNAFHLYCFNTNDKFTK